MQQLPEGLFYGTWRSYKSFLHTGEVKNHSKDNYLEFVFADDRKLAISNYDNGKSKKLDETTDWSLVFKEKRYYLSVNGKGLEYEIITINHVAFVVQDTQTLDKYFCARVKTWETYIKKTEPYTL